MAILLDYNQAIIASVAMNQKHFTDVDMSMIRHMFLNTLLSCRKKFGEKYGEFVICADSRDNWRKDYFPYYKAGRKKSRTESPLDWQLIFESIDTLREELENHFPYPVVKVNRAEGDDIIGALCNYFLCHEMQNDGFFEEPQPVIILSNDKDFKQLQVYDNVDQYSPIQDKHIKEKNPKQYLKEQIIRGDGADGVPNFLSGDDFLVEGKRQRPIRQVKLDEWLGCESPEEFCDEEMLKNYRRNKKMIDLLNEIPQEIETEIVNTYKEAHREPRSSLLNYFIKHRLKNLSQDIQQF